MHYIIMRVTGENNIGSQTTKFNSPVIFSGYAVGLVATLLKALLWCDEDAGMVCHFLVAGLHIWASFTLKKEARRKALKGKL